MNGLTSGHTQGTMAVGIVSSLLVAFTPQVQALAAQHLTATGIIVSVLSVVLGMLPSAKAAS